MLRGIYRQFLLGLVLAVVAAPLRAMGAAGSQSRMTGALAAAPAAPQAPAGGVVGDGSPGSCDETALHNALAGGGTITFNCGGPKTISILSQQTIAAATTLDGGGSITITGGLATRLFDVADNVPFTLRSIVLDSGYSGAADGGAISSGGILTLEGVTIGYSQTDDNHSGGAIFTTGPVFISDSYLYHNSGGNGGAIFAYTANAVVQITYTYVGYNHATNGVVVGGGKGGALWADLGTDVTIRNGLWVYNIAEGDGGAIYSHGALTMLGVLIASNRTTNNAGAVTRGYGGGIASYGPLTVTESFVFNNRSLYGGGLFVGEPSVATLAQVDNSLLERNRALYWGGGLFTSSASTALIITRTLFENNTADFGGGLARDGTNLYIARTSIGRNTATTGGGIGNRPGGLGPGPVTYVFDTTIYSNVVTSTLGGGIANQALMDLRNVTLEGNDSGVYNNASGTPMTMANTVLHSLGANCAGVLPSSQGGNFSDDTSCGLGATNNDVQGAGLDPQLGPFMTNYANTAFFFPLAGSPLINTAFAACSALDQRGAQRPDACDKGAVEYRGMLPALWLPMVRRAP